MAIRDNRDGTFTDTDTGQVLGTPRETGGRNVRSSIRDVQRAVGGRGQAAPPPAATTSDDPVADILARLAAAIIDGSDTNAFNSSPCL